MNNAEVITQGLKVIEDQFYNADDTKLYENFDINRELPRYVFSLGNHLEEDDRRAFGSNTGGIWVGNSEVEGAPTMWRTKGFMSTMQIVPLEKRAIPKKADHREEEKRKENYMTGEGVPAGTRGYMVYPGDNLNYLKSDRFKPMGLVEIESLIGNEWKTQIALKMQLFFFPNFYNWLTGDKPFPVKIDDRLNLVHEALQRAEEAGLEPFEKAAKNMLTSGQLFSSYASSHIEKNRQIIMSLRTTNNGGFYVGWNGKSVSFARQLGIRLEDEREIQGIKSVSKEDQELIVKEIQKEREASEKRFNSMMSTMTGLLAVIAKQTGVDLSSLGMEIPSNPEEKEETVDVEELIKKQEYTEEPDISMGVSEESGLKEAVLTREDKHEETQNILDPTPDGRCHFLKEGARCNKQLIGDNKDSRLYCNKCEKLVK